jgi:hypothetical protein
MMLVPLLISAALATAAADAGAQSKAVAEPSCTSGPYRLQLPKSYAAVRRLGTLRRDRIVKTEDLGTHTLTYRELRFNGLELELVTSSDKPNQYVVSRAIVSSRAWRIGGPLRVGASVKTALKGLKATDLTSDREMEFSGEKDSIRVNVARSRILDFEYLCSTN